MTQLSLAGTTGLVLPPDADPNRDAWCTPKWLTDLLPEVDLDPCSNPRSTVRADRTYSLESGMSGLELPWCGLVFCNPPYSNVLPWVFKLEQERETAIRLAPGWSSVGLSGCAFLVNADHSTRWWKRLTRSLRIRLDFDDRIQFSPPPGIEPSTNNKPQALLMDDGFLSQCSNDLLVCGTLWERR